MCCLRYVKGQESIVCYKTEYSHLNFIEQYISKPTKGRGRPKKSASLSKAYNCVLPISEANLNDLKKCAKI